VGDLHQLVVHVALEGGGRFQVEGEVELPALAAEVLLQLPDRTAKERWPAFRRVGMAVLGEGTELDAT
jgi:hypothetical protein